MQTPPSRRAGPPLRSGWPPGRRRTLEGARAWHALTVTQRDSEKPDITTKSCKCCKLQYSSSIGPAGCRAVGNPARVLFYNVRCERFLDCQDCIGKSLQRKCQHLECDQGCWIFACLDYTSGFCIDHPQAVLSTEFRNGLVRRTERIISRSCSCWPRKSSYSDQQSFGDMCSSYGRGPQNQCVERFQKRKSSYFGETRGQLYSNFFQRSG